MGIHGGSCIAKAFLFKPFVTLRNNTPLHEVMNGKRREFVEEYIDSIPAKHREMSLFVDCFFNVDAAHCVYSLLPSKLSVDTCALFTNGYLSARGGKDLKSLLFTKKRKLDEEDDDDSRSYLEIYEDDKGKYDEECIQKFEKKLKSACSNFVARLNYNNSIPEVFFGLDQTHYDDDPIQKLRNVERPESNNQTRVKVLKKSYDRLLDFFRKSKYTVLTIDEYGEGEWKCLASIVNSSRPSTTLRIIEGNDNDVIYMLMVVYSICKPSFSTLYVSKNVYYPYFHDLPFWDLSDLPFDLPKGSNEEWLYSLIFVMSCLNFGNDYCAQMISCNEKTVIETKNHCGKLVKMWCNNSENLADFVNWLKFVPPSTCSKQMKKSLNSRMAFLFDIIFYHAYNLQKHTHKSKTSLEDNKRKKLTLEYMKTIYSKENYESDRLDRNISSLSPTFKKHCRRLIWTIAYYNDFAGFKNSIFRENRDIGGLFGMNWLKYIRQKQYTQSLENCVLDDDASSSSIRCFPAVKFQDKILLEWNGDSSSIIKEVMSVFH